MILAYKSLIRTQLTRMRIKRTKTKETKQKTRKMVKKRRRKTTRKISSKTHLTLIFHNCWKRAQQSGQRTIAWAEKAKWLNCWELQQPVLEEDWMKAIMKTPTILVLSSKSRLCEAEAKMTVKVRIPREGLTKTKRVKIVLTRKLSNQLFSLTEIELALMLGMVKCWT